MIKYTLETTASFKKDYKRIVKRQYDVSLLNDAVEKLLSGISLPPEYSDHPLSGNWKGYRKCHIQSDWVLIYKIFDDVLILSLTRTGTHSDVRFD